MNLFDRIDVFYLANSLSVAQLRHEMHAAEVKASLAEAYRDTEYQTEDDFFPWHDYAAACMGAIECIRQSQPKLQPTNRHIDTEAIKAKNDIVTIIEQYTRLRKAGKNFTGRCPIHHDKRPSLTVYPDNQTWHCYGCNRGGDVIAFVQAVENTDFSGAAAMLRSR